MNKLAYREKFTCEMIWGGIPTDIDWVKSSPMFNDGLKRFDNGEWKQFEKEVWKKAIDHNECYLISSFGRFKSVITVVGRRRKPAKIRELILKTYINKKGYEEINFTLSNINKERIRKTFRVHRLVSHYFIGEQEEKMQVNHKDGNKLNNHLSNLEYVTGSENILHAFRTGLKQNKCGGNSPLAKLTNKQAEDIRQKCKEKSSSIREIALLYNVHEATIRLIKRGITYKN